MSFDINFMSVSRFIFMYIVYVWVRSHIIYFINTIIHFISSTNLYIYLPTYALVFYVFIAMHASVRIRVVTVRCMFIIFIRWFKINLHAFLYVCVCINLSLSTFDIFFYVFVVIFMYSSYIWVESHIVCVLLFELLFVNLNK